MRVLGIIPARAGSKRIKNKNIKSLNGFPLIAYTIAAGKNSKLINRLVVSTDSDEIAAISKKLGAEVPFIRPDKIAGDLANSTDVINHALRYFEGENEFFDVVVMLQPTSPLRTSSDIDNAIKLLNQEFQSLVSVCKTSHSPLWVNTLPENHSMKSFLSNPLLKTKRSQDLPVYYRLNGAIYAAYTKYFIENGGFYGDQTKAYIMPEDRSIDIDGELDFKLASFLLRNNE